MYIIIQYSARFEETAPPCLYVRIVDTAYTESCKQSMISFPGTADDEYLGLIAKHTLLGILPWNTPVQLL